jgi:hypothetical protein
MAHAQNKSDDVFCYFFIVSVKYYYIIFVTLVLERFLKTGNIIDANQQVFMINKLRRNLTPVKSAPRRVRPV